MAIASGEVAVVGAGLAGAACSSRLTEQDKSVSLFDMGGRGPGAVPAHIPSLQRLPLSLQQLQKATSMSYHGLVTWSLPLRMPCLALY